jgi:hypothetical protein
MSLIPADAGEEKLTDAVAIVTSVSTPSTMKKR